MKQLSDFSPSHIKYVFTDIDDTLTTKGKLPAQSYKALWDLYDSGLQVIPVTGRPAGWCEMIARFWPVAGVIGENGGLYFKHKNNEMTRHYAQPESLRPEHQKKLELIKSDVLKQVPGAGVASDQFCRQIDLAIDFSEDVPALSKKDVQKIVAIFKSHGAQAKVSSIHVNGWFGDHDKLSMCKTFCEREFNKSLESIIDECAFIGDSPNDEPMFAFFNHSFAVENISQFINELKNPPAFITPSQGAKGFVEFANKLLTK